MRGSRLWARGKRQTAYGIRHEAYGRLSEAKGRETGAGGLEAGTEAWLNRRWSRDRSPMRPNSPEENRGRSAEVR